MFLAARSKVLSAASVVGWAPSMVGFVRPFHRICGDFVAKKDVYLQSKRSMGVSPQRSIALIANQFAHSSAASRRAASTFESFGRGTTYTTPRHDGTLIFGRFKEDEDFIASHPMLSSLRDKAHSLVFDGRRDADAFVHIALAAAKELEKLPGTHRLHFPPHIMFLNRPAPAFPMFEATMEKVFCKACDVHAMLNSTESNNANTASGYGIAGPRGVGKSHMMRLINVLAPLLLPHVVSVFVTGQKPPSASPIQLLRAACGFAGEAWEEGVSKHAVEAFIPTAAQNGVVLMLCVDELRSVYTSDAFWSELHALTEGYYTAVYVADSGSQLRALVKGDTFDDPLRIKTQHGVVQQSLNDKKLTVKPLHPFRTREQYVAYFRGRKLCVPLDASGSQGILPPEQGSLFLPVNLEGLHVWTGGRIREIMRILSNRKEQADVERATGLPALGSASRVLLDALCLKQRSLGGFDPFKMATIDTSQAVGLLEAWQEKQRGNLKGVVAFSDLPWELRSASPTSVMLDVIDKHWATLCVDDEGADVVTFASPLHYILHSRLFPKVFISHAMSDYEGRDPGLMVFVEDLKQMGAKVVLCELPEAAAAAGSATRGSGMFPGWMQRQMQPQLVVNEFAVIVLSDAYVKRASIVGSGAAAELKSAREGMEKTDGLQRRVLLASVGEYRLSEWEGKNDDLDWLLAKGNKFVFKLGKSRSSESEAFALITCIYGGIRVPSWAHSS
jgi:hypothetical protein